MSDKDIKKIIVVSAVNLTEGGPLSILKECLEYLSDNLARKYKIIALVNSENIFAVKNIQFISFPMSKKSWLARLYYEYVYFYSFSKKLNPYLWFSLHDITPNVRSGIRAVYCHNPAPFYKLSLREVFIDQKLALFNAFYEYLYRINISKNDFVVVQQNWLRGKFKNMFKNGKIVVAHPDINLKKQNCFLSEERNTFFYPALPRVFKNFEVICEASERLIRSGVDDFQVLLTIAGNENRYARYIYNLYKHVKQIKFLGAQSRDKIYEIYQKTSCVIFPSRLETWGLPITEAKSFHKKLILSDLEYAHETLGDYDKAKFFNPVDSMQLASIMRNVMDKTIIFDRACPVVVTEPWARNWKELFDILLA